MHMTIRIKAGNYETKQRVCSHAGASETRSGAAELNAKHQHANVVTVAVLKCYLAGVMFYWATNLQEVQLRLMGMLALQGFDHKSKC